MCWYRIIIVLLWMTVGCSGVTEIPTVELRSQDINKVIMCPVCPGESLDQSQHPLAVHMREVVREKLAQGWDDQRIQEYFSDRYGPSVLLKPPVKGFNLIIWVVPPVVGTIALVLLCIAMRLMRTNLNRRRRGISGYVDDPDESNYISRVESALADDNMSPRLALKKPYNASESEVQN